MARKVHNVIGQTPGGKTIVAVMVPNTNLIKVQFEEGGELPKHLAENRWSSIKDVTHDVTLYLEEMAQEAEKAPKKKPSKKVKKEDGES